MRVLLAVLASATAMAHAAAPPPLAQPRVVATSCSDAVSQSRMICRSGSDCQKEISPVLRACNAGGATACPAARAELRNYCGKPLPWHGSRECEIALHEVTRVCSR